MTRTISHRWRTPRRARRLQVGTAGLVLLALLTIGIFLGWPRASTAATAAGLPLHGRWTPTSLRRDATALLPVPQQPATFLAATLNGVWRSTDAGATWQPDGSGMQGTAVFILADTTSSADVWAGSFNGRVYLRTGSPSGHAVWQPISPVLLTDPNLGAMPIYSLAVSPLPGHPVLAGSMGAIFSGTLNHGGRTWQWHRVWQWQPPAGGIGPGGVPQSGGASASSGGGAVTSLLVAPWDAHLTYASIFEASPAVEVSHNGGQTWSSGAVNLPATLPAQDLAPGPAPARQIFLTTMGDGVWQQEAGGTWQDISAGLPQRHAMPLLSAPPPASGVLYAGTMASGVYEKQGNNPWRLLGQGLYGLAATVTGLAEIPGPHPVLLAGTSGGVYRYAPHS